MGGFNNPVVGALALIRAAIRSPNYVAGSTGWTINKDGTAEFNTLGGSFQITANGIFFYVPAAGSGTLVASFSNAGGFDPYGNQYVGGFFLNQKQGWFTGDQSDTIVINPNGALGPELLFAEALAAFSFHIQVRSNEVFLEQTNSSGAKLNLNMPVYATGGIQGSSSPAVAQPPFNVTGTMVDFASNKWAPLTMVCPPSETVEININLVGFNNNSTTSTLTVAVGVKAGSTVIMAPLQYQNGATITPEGAAAASTSLHQKFRQYVVGKDKLGGFAGQTLTFTPAWQISTGSAATASIDNTASFSVNPRLFTQFQSG